jgi:hypothetical protein
MEDCPSCGQSLKYIGKSSENTAHGHRARQFRCNNDDCHRDIVHGGWVNA